jgi:hypothetical protein
MILMNLLERLMRALSMLVRFDHTNKQPQTLEWCQLTTLVFFLNRSY